MKIGEKFKCGNFREWMKDSETEIEGKNKKRMKWRVGEYKKVMMLGLIK